MAKRGSDPPEIDLEPDLPAEARAAGLRYVRDEEPGIHRRPCGRGFTYRLPDGSTLRADEERARIEALAIPPAWTDVWVCRDPEGHLQATGRDDRDRKQYLYHQRWDDVRDRIKFRRLLLFGHRLPRLRRRVGRDLKGDDLGLERVVAGAVRILDRTGIRIGSPEYEEKNGSYGLTTLRRRHVDAEGSTITLEFRGKSGRDVQMDLRDATLASLVRDTLDLPGWKALKYVDGAGERRPVTPQEVNEYIGRAAAGPFTAKDFRTWRATVVMVARLRAEEPADEEGRKARWLAAVDEVASKLANTRTVARESYLPPGLEGLYLEGGYHDRLDALADRVGALSVPGRRRAEPVTLALLEELLDA